MRRVLRLTDRFFLDRSLLVTPRTLPAAALAATLGRLLDGALPGPLDLPTLIPAAGEGWARRVPGASLWIYYTFTGDALTIHALGRSDPIRIDE